MPCAVAMDTREERINRQRMRKMHISNEQPQANPERRARHKRAASVGQRALDCMSTDICHRMLHKSLVCTQTRPQTAAAWSLRNAQAVVLALATLGNLVSGSCVSQVRGCVQMRMQLHASSDSMAGPERGHFDTMRDAGGRVAEWIGAGGSVQGNVSGLAAFFVALHCHDRRFGYYKYRFDSQPLGQTYPPGLIGCVHHSELSCAWDIDRGS